MTAAPVRVPVRSAAGWLRIAARLAAMLGLLAACAPACYLARLSGHATNPWPKRFLGGIARIAGLRVSVAGQLPTGRRLLLANHISWTDIPVLAQATGTAFVAHDGLASIPLLRWLCVLADTVFVARHDRRGIARQIASVRAALADCGALTVFPEGTTSDGIGLLPFKSSLLAALDPTPADLAPVDAAPMAASLAVQPVWLDYGADGPDIAWVGEEHGLANFLRILARRRRITVTVHLLAPLAEAQLSSRKAMAQAARASILSAIARG